MIKAVIFDVDGVLLDSFEANLKSFQDLMVMNGYKPPTREEYRPLFHLPLKDLIKVLTASNSNEEIERLYGVRLNREIPSPPELLKMPDGAKEAIEALSDKYLLGIVTNRVKRNVYEGPQLAKLEHYFRAAVAYEDTEKHKPDPEPLLLAASKLGIEPREAVYIGDTESDGKAAKSANMKFILYSNETLDSADFCTFSFRKLPELIASL